MRFTLRRSPSLTSVPLPSLRLRFLSFDVRMWRRCECPRFTFPVAVFLKRLAAPLCVFNFGIKPQQLTFGIQHLAKQKNARAFSRLAKCQVLSANCDEFCNSSLKPRYDAGFATCAGAGFGATALCAAAFCFLSFSFS